MYKGFKMFNPVERTDLNQISLTGLRAIVMLGLLIKAPHSLEDIRQIFVKYNILEPSQPADILRIDLNTLKHIGCKISRATRKTNFKYVLLENPFAIKIDENDIKLLKKVYKRLKAEADIEALISFDELMRKISEHVFNADYKESVLGISVLKRFDVDMIKCLLEDCKYKKTLKLVYKRPTSKQDVEKEIIAQKLVFQNDQIYLYGIDNSIGESTVLSIRRIIKIISRRLQECSITPKLVNVKFLLKRCNPDILTEAENVVEILEDGFIAQGAYYNKFLATQRMLSFGSKCTVLEPESFKELIIEKLKEMRKVYEL